MTKYVFWNKASDLYPPSGGKMTKEDIFKEWGWAENPDIHVVIGMQGGIMGSFDNLEVLKGVYDIDADDPEVALALINEKANAPAPEPEPTAEERIAAALEFQNLMSL